MGAFQKMQALAKAEGMAELGRYSARYGEVYVSEQFRMGLRRGHQDYNTVTARPHYRIIWFSIQRTAKDGKGDKVEGSFFDILAANARSESERMAISKREIAEWFEINKSTGRLEQG